MSQCPKEETDVQKMYPTSKSFPSLQYLTLHDYYLQVKYRNFLSGSDIINHFQKYLNNKFQHSMVIFMYFFVFF